MHRPPSVCTTSLPSAAAIRWMWMASAAPASLPRGALTPLRIGPNLNQTTADDVAGREGRARSKGIHHDTLTSAPSIII
ncbi:hypothetical protein M430DRAFT_35316 [Amorphotheca resinae ATCC 22711]|uniref:Uncharacterized protein n=1 Tax=Amorphotheca resinae ATCC 22711 TaxID=857342 RepID=A0A2T3AZJ3_AMORE|nr:hypothetical protein M430DRAFT_35316 [Amorphotheca resinae ATCC 22711]PSS16574.1 hypothetical protein M430DRAFT_35316 [Amorphotheca resinae ATCC 22711]